MRCCMQDDVSQYMLSIAGDKPIYGTMTVTNDAAKLLETPQFKISGLDVTA